jgi:hypothetical protein
MKKLKLPLKLKKQILGFVKEYESLACPRDIKIVIPRQEHVCTVVWCGDQHVEIGGDDTEKICFADQLYESSTITKINKDIKSFCERTKKFGTKHFGEADALWYSVLWNFRPEKGETLKGTHYITWV